MTKADATIQGDNPEIPAIDSLTAVVFTITDAKFFFLFVTLTDKII